MGRTEFLTRMALGRSAFQAPNEQLQNQAEAEQPNSDGANDQGLLINGQLYDQKGRPINPTTQKRDSDLRRAQNSVLELVGVVEKRAEIEQRVVQNIRLTRQAMGQVLNAEQDRGDDLELLLCAVAPFIFMWPTALLLRSQIGFFNPAQSFIHIITSFWKPAGVTGIKSWLATLLPGAVAILASASVRALLGTALELTTGQIQEFVLSKRSLRRGQTVTLFHLIDGLFAVLLMAIDVALMPLDFYARAQQLGLAPAFPLLPSVSNILSRQPGSLYEAASKPLINIPILKAVLSAAGILLTRSILKENTDETTPVNASLTAFRYPNDITQCPTELEVPVYKDPIGWTLYTVSSLRIKTLSWLGWNVFSTEGSTEHVRYANTVIYDYNDGSRPWTYQRHRSTTLAHLPVQYLANHLNNRLMRLIMLPWDSLGLRIVAASYMNSTLPKTANAVLAQAHMYAPFGGGPLGALWPFGGGNSSWAEIGLYANRVGLSLCLLTSVEAAIFGCVWGIVRRQGKLNFMWQHDRFKRQIVHTGDEVDEHHHDEIEEEVE